MRHPNILMIMAASVKAPDLIIVTELMKSDLFSLLVGKEKFELKERLQIGIDIARGNFILFVVIVGQPKFHYISDDRNDILARNETNYDSS